MPNLKNCGCWRCNHRWQDFPGCWAKLTCPQFPGDARDGCPNCGHLYWSETDEMTSDSDRNRMAETARLRAQHEGAGRQASPTFPEHRCELGYLWCPGCSRQLASHGWCEACETYPDEWLNVEPPKVGFTVEQQNKRRAAA